MAANTISKSRGGERGHPSLGEVVGLKEASREVDVGATFAGIGDHLQSENVEAMQHE